MSSHSPSVDSPYLIHRIPPTRPFVWLARAWEDLKHHPLPSLAYGILVSALGAIVLMFNNHPYMVAGSLTAFLLVGPIMTSGLCELSRRRDSGELCSFEDSLRALRHNREGLLGFAKRLLVIGVTWMLLSAVLMQAALGSTAPALGETVWGGAWSALSAQQLLIYLGLWGLLSVIVFGISVVSIPMILDLNSDAATAMRTSLRVTARDLPAMVVWAALILVLVGLGFLTGLAGMVVVFPLLGHATWYAYRELVH
jgi:uncharacterized membrane protein